MSVKAERRFVRCPFLSNKTAWRAYKSQVERRTVSRGVLSANWLRLGVASSEASVREHGHMTLGFEV